MTLLRLALAVALCAAVPSFTPAEDKPITTRTHVENLEVTLSGTSATSVSYKHTVVTPTGRMIRSGRTSRPQVKSEEKEETIDVIDKVVVKDSKGKEGKGDFSQLAAGQAVRLHVSKESVRVPGDKQPTVKMVVTQIDVIHTAAKK